MILNIMLSYIGTVAIISSLSIIYDLYRADFHNGLMAHPLTHICAFGPFYRLFDHWTSPHKGLIHIGEDIPKVPRNYRCK